MKVSKTDLLKMFRDGLGFKQADKWELDRYRQMIAKLPDIADSLKDDNKEAASLFKKLMKALKEKEDIEIVTDEDDKDKKKVKDDDDKPKKGKKSKKKDEDDDDEEEEEEEEEEDEDDEEEEDEEEDEKPKKKKKKSKDDDDDDEEEEEEEEDDDEDEDEDDEPKKKGKKKKSKKDDEDDDEEEEEEDEDEDEDEEEEDKPKKKKKKSKMTGPIKKIGVTRKILECIATASKAEPITKKSILKKLVKKFPQKPESALKNTLSYKLAFFVQDGRIGKNDEGFYPSKKFKLKKEE